MLVVIWLHHYFYACIDIVDLTRDPVIGELTVRLHTCARSHMDATMDVTAFSYICM